MPGLVPGIHEFSSDGVQVVDGRDKPGHDAERAMLLCRHLLNLASPVVSATHPFRIASTVS
jgi:hypothetical protein